MNNPRIWRHCILALTAACGFLIIPSRSDGADPGPAIPAVILAGFDSWNKGSGFDGALYIWQKGGLMDGNRKTSELAVQLKPANQAVGNYKSHEVLRTDHIGKFSQVLYLSLNFERGAVYSRFVLYRTDKGWVVQDMDFDTRPETIMPWLTLAAEKSTE